MAKKTSPVKSPESFPSVDSRGRTVSLEVLSSKDGMNVFSVAVNGDRVRVTTTLSAEEYLKAL